MSATAAPAPRKLFVTTALPYANGPFHIGHIMEYIQADIWVRFQRMQGHEVHFVCADDAHGAPIMLKAQDEGITPEQLIARVARSHIEDWKRYHISFDTTHSTHSPENVELAQGIYRKLRDRKPSLIATKTIEQFYDPVKGMFLADRYIKGTCPKCGAKDQYGDACEVCGSTYAPTDLIDPLLDADRRQAGTAPLRAPVLSPVRSGGRRVPRALDEGNAAAARGVQQDPGVAGRQVRTDGGEARSTTGTSRAKRRTSASRCRMRRASTSTSGSTRRSATSPR